ncbi:monothiol glutaredoxin grx5 [Tieghemiomyces parasiticus]|uniref:Monothiol glutaredoxin grx5 n=1 Tax=Tieghemiomyces parasiticus TaxID=78921 RepID=A0A9W8E2R7_9FUNG|nr:monothiol glutaredoxin grx5 [Tieghemiomyces parasiticus]
MSRIFNLTKHAALRTGPFVRLQSRWLSDATKAAIEKEIKGNDVCVFMKGTPDEPMVSMSPGFNGRRLYRMFSVLQPSRATVTMLTVQGVRNFKGVNVLEDPDLRSGIKEYSQWPTIPQVYVKGEFVGGCDIMLNMHKSGELESLLVKEGLIEPMTEASAADQSMTGDKKGSS